MGAMGWGNFVLGTGPERQRRAMKHSSIPRNTSMQHKNLHSVFQELAIIFATCIYPFRLAFGFAYDKKSAKQLATSPLLPRKGWSCPHPILPPRGRISRGELEKLCCHLRAKHSVGLAIKTRINISRRGAERQRAQRALELITILAFEEITTRCNKDTSALPQGC